ncbi:MAG: AI-2E family transporter [Verrucomicrobiaceae bacterium]|nr:AI-2E family transporter [Verrucomicrobiaceae bacterium]
MLIPRKKVPAAESLEMISNLLLTAFVFGVLYFGRELLIPLALAALLTFLLAPLVTKLHRFLGRVGSVLFVVAMLFCAAGFVGTVLTRQAVDLASQLPEYKENISSKLRGIQLPRFRFTGRLTETVDAWKQDLAGVLQSGSSSEEEGEGESLGENNAGSSANGRETTSTSEPETDAGEVPATPVEVVSGKNERLEMVQFVLAPVLESLATAALVVLLLIFMLLRREDLRHRILRLVGQGRISETSRAMDEAGASVARYLLMQLVVNVTYGIPVAVGLYFIGVPNAILWGALCTVLRFIPYVGPWIGALFPILMSLVVSPGWMAPILTISLFILLELISNNVAEPLLYGSTTGVTPIALIVAALAWTWLWGPVGLVLATPITVCFVVMGRHIPRRSFFSVLLSDERPLSAAEECYQWLQRRGEGEEFEFVDQYLEEHSEEDLYESVLLPVLSTAESDYREEMLSRKGLVRLHRRVGAVIEDLELRFGQDNPEPPAESGKSLRIFCVPVSSFRDELAGDMLVNLLHRRGVEAGNAPAKLVSGELLGWIKEASAEVVCLLAVTPTTFYQVRYLCVKLRTRFPEIKMVVALREVAGGSESGNGDGGTVLQECGADEVVTSLGDAVSAVVVLASRLRVER